MQEEKYIFSERQFNNVLERAKEVAKADSWKELGDVLGLRPNALANRRKSRSLPWDQLFELAESRNVNFGWLITGDGIKEKFGEGEVDLNVGQDPDYSEVPLYDVEASAGSGSLFDEEPIISYLKFRNDWLVSEGLNLKDLVAFRVAGDSMHSTLADSDTVLINRARTKPDGVFAIRIGEGLRIKRLQQLVDGSLRVSSDNDVYADETIPKENLGQVEIIGFCHWRSGRVF